MILLFVFAFTTPSNAMLEVNYAFESSIFIGFAILALITFVVAIWNLVQAIKVLR